MGRRKKKPFINKKEAQTYRLVPRSHHDPLAGDVEEAQHVLKPDQPQESGGEDRATEQKKFGIYFEDDYDYLQHLKAPGTAVMEPVGLSTADNATDSTRRHVSLPDELFGQEVAIAGHLDKVLPVSGPRPDWDPEIVEALENAEASSDIEQELEDDFVLQANSGEPGLPVYVTEQLQEKVPEEGVWWKGRGDFGHPSVEDDELAAEGEESNEEGEQSSTLGSMDCFHDNTLEKRGAQFTQYSMTSSVVPRSEALTLLDDQFEEFMAGYNDDQLGAGEEGGVAEGACPESRRSEYDKMLLQTAVEDFEKNFLETHTLDDETGCGHRREELEEEDGSGTDSSSGELESEEEEEKDELDILEVEEISKKDKWDCESILSTYSTLYNHPTRIVEPRAIKTTPPSDSTTTTSSNSKEIKLSRKTGMPLGVIPGPLPKENHPCRGTITRPRNENKEEKRARKLAVKEDRKQRRLDKKATKLAFKAEAMKQMKVLQNSSTRMATVA